MGWMEFVAELVSAIAWPAAVLVIIYLLRGQIALLIPTLREFEYGKFKMRFGKEIQDIRESAPHLAGSVLGAIAPSSSPAFESIFNLAEASPRAAVTEAWRILESELRAAARRNNLDVSAKLPAGRLLNDLYQRDLISKELRDIGDRLRVLRNDAVHAPEFELGSDEARGFADVIQGLVSWLEANL